MQKKTFFAYAIAIAGIVILSGAAVTPALSRDAQKAMNATAYQLQSAELELCLCSAAGRTPARAMGSAGSQPTPAAPTATGAPAPIRWRAIHRSIRHTIRNGKNGREQRAGPPGPPFFSVVLLGSSKLFVNGQRDFVTARIAYLRNQSPCSRVSFRYVKADTEGD